jgi:hypothetical protein
MGDGGVRLYAVPDPEELLPGAIDTVVAVLEPSAVVRWSNRVPVTMRWHPTRPSVLVVGYGDGSLQAFDIGSSLMAIPTTIGALSSLDRGCLIRPRNPAASVFRLRPTRTFTSPDTHVLGRETTAALAVNISSAAPRLLISGHRNGSVCLWDLDGGTAQSHMPLREISLCHRAITAIAFDPHFPGMFVMGMDNGDMIRYDTLTDSTESILYGTEYPGHAHCWDMDLVLPPYPLSNALAGDPRPNYPLFMMASGDGGAWMGRLVNSREHHSILRTNHPGAPARALKTLATAFPKVRKQAEAAGNGSKPQDGSGRPIPSIGSLVPMPELDLRSYMQAIVPPLPPTSPLITGDVRRTYGQNRVFLPYFASHRIRVAPVYRATVHYLGLRPGEEEQRFDSRSVVIVGGGEGILRVRVVDCAAEFDDPVEFGPRLRSSIDLQKQLRAAHPHFWQTVKAGLSMVPLPGEDINRGLGKEKAKQSANKKKSKNGKKRRGGESSDNSDNDDGASDHPAGYPEGDASAMHQIRQSDAELMELDRLDTVHIVGDTTDQLGFELTAILGNGWEDAVANMRSRVANSASNTCAGVEEDQELTDKVSGRRAQADNARKTERQQTKRGSKALRADRREDRDNDSDSDESEASSGVTDEPSSDVEFYSDDSHSNPSDNHGSEVSDDDDEANEPYEHFSAPRTASHRDGSHDRGRVSAATSIPAWKMTTMKNGSTRAIGLGMDLFDLAMLHSGSAMVESAAPSPSSIMPMDAAAMADTLSALPLPSIPTMNSNSSDQHIF